jgi:glycosyltransferase involved in cell wall biosynthesis
MKKVLFIAYFFPPLGWSGVQRSLKYVKYLRDFGWEPVVVTVGSTRFPIKDETLQAEIPKGIEIIRIDDILLKEYTDVMKNQLLDLIKPSIDIIKNSRLTEEYVSELEVKLEQIRNDLFMPDQYIFWANHVLAKIEQKVDFNEISLLYTTSGPYSSHTIGYNLKCKYNLPWVADFRDEWTNNPYFCFNEESLRFKMERELERNIVTMADKIITISPVSAENYITIFSLDHKKVKTITNGYDEADFAGLKAIGYKNSKFTIVHNGTFYLIRQPDTFLEAIYQLVNKKMIKKEHLCIKFIGRCDANYKANIIKKDPDNLIEWVPYVSHKESLELTLTADMLLLVVGADPRTKSFYTGKAFEYLRMKKPILALSPKESVIEKLLTITRCGENVEYTDLQGIQNHIYKYYHNWLKGSNEYTVNEAEIKKYERKNLTRELAMVFEELIR